MSSKILVVDDDPAIAEMLTMVMEREGFDTVVVDDGLEAVKAAERENPDLILLDLMLPGMGGVDVCRTVRETSAVPIIMLTAKTDTVDVVRRSTFLQTHRARRVRQHPIRRTTKGIGHGYGKSCN